MENFHRKLEQHNKLLCPFPATFRSYQFMDDVVIYHTVSCLPILLIFSKQTPDIIPVNIMVYLQNRFFQSTTEISLSHQKKKKKISASSVWSNIYSVHILYISTIILEKEMATHSSILAWRIPWTGEPGELQSLGSQRVRHDWATKPSLSSYNF